MTTLHMKTEEVRNAAHQLDLAVGELYFKPGRLKSAAGSLRSAWQGGKSNYYANQLQQMANTLHEEIINLQRIVKRLYSEVDEWEDADSFDFNLGHLGIGVSPAIIGTIHSARDAKPENMMMLAQRVASLYDKDENGIYTPIRVVKIGTNEFLILIAGTVGGVWANNWNSALMSGAGLPNDYQRQITEILDKDIPDGATVNFVGHSQGGIMGNNLAADPSIRNRLHVRSVTTFGAPVSAEPQNGEFGEANIEYRRYAARGDIVPRLSRQAAIDALLGRNPFQDAELRQNVISGSSGNFVDDHRVYSASKELASETNLPFEISQWEDIRYYKPERASSLSVIGIFTPIGILNPLDAFAHVQDSVQRFLK